MSYKTLIDKMNLVQNIDENTLYKQTISVENFNILTIRDYIVEAGEVVDEYLDQSIYVAYFRTGFLNLDRTLVGFQLVNKELKIITYSTKKTVKEKLMNKIIDELVHGKKVSKKKPKIIILAILSVILGTSMIFIPSNMIATNKYNKSILEFNELASEYNKKVVLVSVDNIEGVPNEVELLNKERTDIFSIMFNVFKGNSAKKIKKDIVTIEHMKTVLKDGSLIIDNILCPSEKGVVSKLKNIEEIDKIASVTKDNDPNGFLNKEHGYRSCVYFTIDGLKLKNESTDPVVLGTDGGGCIEVYANLKDAQDRCEYLKQFDETILYTGSYAIVGTMVVRTSYVLTNEQQFSLTDKIIKQFTNIE